MEAAIVILGTAVVIATGTKLLQQKLIDKKRIDTLRKEIKEDQKKFTALIKDTNKNQQEFDDLQAKIIKNNTEMMSSNMKVSLFTIPAFLIVFWILGMIYGGQVLVSIIPLPTFNGFNLFNPFTWVPIGFAFTTGYYKMYFVYYFIIGLAISIIERVFIKSKKD